MALLGVLSLADSAGAVEPLLNDGWPDGGPAAFQNGFSAGDIVAVRLVPTVQCPCQVKGVQLL